MSDLIAWLLSADSPAHLIGLALVVALVVWLARRNESAHRDMVRRIDDHHDDLMAEIKEVHRRVDRILESRHE